MGRENFRLPIGLQKATRESPFNRSSMPIRSCFSNLLKWHAMEFRWRPKADQLIWYLIRPRIIQMFCTFCNRCQRQREDQALPRLHQAVQLHHRGLDLILGSHPKGKVKASHKGLWQSRCHRVWSKAFLGHEMEMQSVLIIIWTSVNCRWIVADAVKDYIFAVIVGVSSKTIRIRRAHRASPQPDNETKRTHGKVNSIERLKMQHPKWEGMNNCPKSNLLSKPCMKPCQWLL